MLIGLFGRRLSFVMEEGTRRVGVLKTIKTIPTVTKRGPESLLETFKPLIFTLQSLGRLPCTIESNRGLVFRFFSPLTLYTGFVFLVQFYLSFHAVSTIFQWKKKNGTTSILWANFSIAFLHNFIIPFTFWIDTDNVIKYFRLWDEFQDYYFLILKNHLKFHYGKHAKFMAVMNPPVLVIIAYLTKDLLFGLTVAEFCLASIPIITCFGAVNLIWFFTLNEIRFIAENIINRLVQLDVDGREAGELRRLWLKLSRLYILLGESFGSCTIAFGANNFVNVICVVYGLIRMISVNSRFEVSYLYILITCASYFISWMIFLEMNSRIAETMGSKSAAILLEINFTTRDPLYEREIRLLLQTLDLYPPKMTIKGFFIADRNVARVQIRSMFTYIIILLQSMPVNRISPTDL